MRMTQVSLCLAIVLTCAARAQEVVDSLSIPPPHYDRLIDIPDVETIDPQLLDLIDQLSDTTRRAAPEELGAVPDPTGERDPTRPPPRDPPSMGAAQAVRAWSVRLRMRGQQEDEPRRGQVTGVYPGSRLDAGARLIINAPGGWQVGVVADRDAGEAAAIDRIGGCMRYEGAGILRTALLGDFTVNAGQGLVFWKTGGWSKGAETVSSQKRADVLLRPHLSSGVNASMRGVAVQLGGAGWDAAAFAAATSLDASIDTTTGLPGSFDASGLHRTATELSRRAAVQERITGAVVRVMREIGVARLTIGAAASLSSVDRAPIGGPLPPLDAGRTLIGCHADLHLPGANIYGELARAPDADLAGIVGIVARLGTPMTVSLLYRSYAPGFRSMHGNGWGEQSGATANETGLYLGVRLRVARGLLIAAYADQFRFPGRRWLVPVPTSGNDRMLLVEWRALPHCTVTLRASRRERQDALTMEDADGRTVRPVVDRIQWRGRVELEYDDHRAWLLRARAEWTEVTHAIGPPVQRGLLLSADIRRRLAPVLTLAAGVAGGGADAWDARLTVVDVDAPGHASITTFSTAGMRVHGSITWRPSEWLSLLARYSVMVLDGVREIGSGYDVIAGDRVGKWMMQMDVRW